MKSMQKVALVFALALSFLNTAPALAERHSEVIETVDLRTSFRLSPQEMQSVSLNGWRQVKKIYINAVGNHGEAMFDVLVNGDVKGTVHVPGRDPLYVVTIGEVASSIEFRHLSGSSVDIQRVQVVQSERSFGDREYPNWNCTNGCQAEIHFPARNEASFIGRRGIELVDSLQGFSDYKEFGEYLLPIKKAAARLYAAAEARGPLSGKVRELLLCLKAQITFARPYIENTFERTQAFDLAVELLSLEYKLGGALN